jgi:hypothetical protein
MNQEPTLATPSTEKPQLPNVPSEWPGGFGLYKYSKQAVLRNWVVLIALSVISGFLSIIANGFQGNTKNILVIVLELVTLVLGVASVHVYLQSVKGEKTDVASALRFGFNLKLVVKLLLAQIVVALLLFVSLLLLLIPFFFVLPRLLLVSYYLIDKDLGPIEAVKESWNASKGHSMKLWSIVGAAIAMALLMLTVIGIPFALYFLFMYSAATAVTYYYIEAHRVASTEPVVAPVETSQPAQL